MLHLLMATEASQQWLVCFLETNWNSKNLYIYKTNNTLSQQSEEKTNSNQQTTDDRLTDNWDNNSQLHKTTKKLPAGLNQQANINH